jgi:hypothetical protein
VRGRVLTQRRGGAEFLSFFLLQALFYGVLCWNYRAVAQARYASIGVSDMACAAISWTLIKRIGEAKSKWAQAGFILGGACGSLLSVWITKQVFGQ